MPSHMSFAMTTEQVMAETKTVTRRFGWLKLKPGTKLWAVEKAMGLKPGEKVKRLKLIEVVSVRREPLHTITPDDVRLEGFPGWTPEQFIEFLLAKNKKLTSAAIVNRIEFKYVGEPE